MVVKNKLAWSSIEAVNRDFGSCLYDLQNFKMLYTKEDMPALWERYIKEGFKNYMVSFLELTKAMLYYKTIDLNIKSKNFYDYLLACTIMHSPELLILDEPINGLDPVGIKEIRALLKTLAHDYGTTILISSHILSEIEHIADVIGVMDHGNLIEELSKEELENRLNKHADFKVSDIQLASEILKQSGFRENIDFIVKKTPENNTSIRLFNHLDLRDEINEKFVKSGIKVSELMLCEENLEEFFTRLIGNDVRFS